MTAGLVSLADFQNLDHPDFRHDFIIYLFMGNSNGMDWDLREGIVCLLSSNISTKRCYKNLVLYLTITFAMKSHD